MYSFSSFYQAGDNLHGQAWRLETPDNLYYQINLANGIKVRIRAPNTSNPFWTGTLLNPNTTKKDKDYRTFKNLTDRLLELTQLEIPNTDESYLSQSETGKDFHDEIVRLLIARKKINGLTAAFLKKEDSELLKSYIPNEAYLKKAQQTGLVTSGLFYSALLMGMYSLNQVGAGIFVTAILGLVDAVSLLAEWMTDDKWIGLTSCIGYCLSHKKKYNELKDLKKIARKIPDIWNEIEKIQEEAKTRSTQGKGTIHLAERKTRALERLAACEKTLQRGMETPGDYKGLSIILRGITKEELEAKFDYLLSDGTGKKPTTNNTQQPTPNTTPSQDNTTTTKEPTNIDPWCNLEETQEKPIDPWAKLESKIQ
ncbi:hypothetical protein HZA97_04650 [Candidatus Woesearchaeota archaeon]|nr:hypothetical protein [Candidatus Woesearchaeota archaeon]